MNLKEFLEQNKIIKESALAVLMWPDKNNQAKVFSNKITEKATGKNGSKQRITEGDEARAKVVLSEVADRIKAYTGDQAIAPVVRVEKKPVLKKEEPKRLNLAAEMDRLRKEGK